MLKLNYHKIYNPLHVQYSSLITFVKTRSNHTEYHIHMLEYLYKKVLSSALFLPSRPTRRLFDDSSPAHVLLVSPILLVFRFLSDGSKQIVVPRERMRRKSHPETQVTAVSPLTYTDLCLNVSSYSTNKPTAKPSTILVFVPVQPRCSEQPYLKLAGPSFKFALPQRRHAV